jgi:hypothetical protein
VILSSLLYKHSENQKLTHVKMHELSIRIFLLIVNISLFATIIALIYHLVAPSYYNTPHQWSYIASAIYLVLLISMIRLLVSYVHRKLLEKKLTLSDNILRQNHLNEDEIDFDPSKYLEPPTVDTDLTSGLFKSEQ